MKKTSPNLLIITILISHFLLTPSTKCFGEGYKREKNILQKFFTSSANQNEKIKVQKTITKNSKLFLEMMSKWLDFTKTTLNAACKTGKKVIASSFKFKGVEARTKMYCEKKTPESCITKMAYYNSDDVCTDLGFANTYDKPCSELGCDGYAPPWPKCGLNSKIFLYVFLAVIAVFVAIAGICVIYHLVKRYRNARRAEPGTPVEPETASATDESTEYDTSDLSSETEDEVSEESYSSSGSSFGTPSDELYYSSEGQP